jgi:acetyl-CoA synthetase
MPPTSSPPPSIWQPAAETIASSNVQWLMQQVGCVDYESLYRWTVTRKADYWRLVLDRLGIVFRKPPREILDMTGGARRARWLVGAELNITDSCFQVDSESTAMIVQRPGEPCREISSGQLRREANRFARSLQLWGVQSGDAVALVLPMSDAAVAAYLGVLKLGAVVVGIPESFSAREIEVRLRLSDARWVVTQDTIRRGDKSLPLYDRFRQLQSPPIVVRETEAAGHVRLRPGDLSWNQFLVEDHREVSEPRAVDDPIGILFSSGTTGEPKAIIWSSHCAIKGAADAHFHHDIHPADVLAWPTSLGWMMGPWLIFAGLINRAAVAVHEGLPTGRDFPRFAQQAGVTMLGVVPSLVAAWRSGNCLEGVDWTGIRLFSSTGECSRPEDMAWLMERAGGRPVVEYCGGTEIAGGYIAGTVVRPCIAGTFNTPALGQDFVILDEEGKPARQGELFLIPPAMGLSSRLLYGDHDEVYYGGCPPGPSGEQLRRHGDELEQLENGYWRAHGRVDDTMNLGGIKVSAAEIEQALQGFPGVRELAAVAEAPADGGPSTLAIYAVPEDAVAAGDQKLPGGPESERLASELRELMQGTLRERSNPLFKIGRVVLLPSLPRTASNKIMRRMLRDRARPA